MKDAKAKGRYGIFSFFTGAGFGIVANVEVLPVANPNFQWEGAWPHAPQRRQKWYNMSTKIDTTTTDLVVESSYVEDAENGEVLNVLVSTKVSPDDKPGDPEPRWTVIADPKTREVVRVEFAVATDEGFEYPDYTRTEEQMALFRRFAKEAA